jgi:hypothetical protein
MVLSTNSERTNLSGRGAGEAMLADGEDLTDPVEAAIADVQSFTVYLRADGEVNVDVEASPDGGDSWFSLPEAPVRFAAAGEEAIHIRYNMTDLRLSADSDVPVTAQLRQVV